MHRLRCEEPGSSWAKRDESRGRRAEREQRRLLNAETSRASVDRKVSVLDCDHFLARPRPNLLKILYVGLDVLSIFDRRETECLKEGLNDLDIQSVDGVSAVVPWVATNVVERACWL